MLPGHGGILDRMDSHFSATPVIITFNIYSYSK